MASFQKGQRVQANLAEGDSCQCRRWHICRETHSLRGLQSVVAGAQLQSFQAWQDFINARLAFLHIVDEDRFPPRWGTSCGRPVTDSTAGPGYRRAVRGGHVRAVAG